MSDSTAQFSVQLDDRWLELPVHSDVDSGDWAAQAVGAALKLRKRAEGPAVLHLYVQTYAALVDQLRERSWAPETQLGSAWALIAEADLLPVTVVEAVLHLLPGGGLASFVDGLVVAPEERFAEPQVAELPTETGVAVRLQQLRIVGADSAEPTVQTSVVYIWCGPTDDTAVTLSAWFDSPVEAELAREAVDDLAISVRMKAV